MASKNEIEREPLLLNDSYQNTKPSNFSGYLHIVDDYAPYKQFGSKQQRRPFVGLLHKNYPRNIPIKWTKTLNRTVGIFILILLILLSLLVVFKVWNVTNTNYRPIYPISDLSIKTQLFSNIDESSELLQVNVFFRHGDRSPETLDHLGMQHLNDKADRIWPHGLGNLTDFGRMRMFRVGMELSKLYRIPLGAPSSDAILAFSSNYSRSIESMRMLLRGFYGSNSLLQNGIELTSIDEQCNKQKSDSSPSQVCKLLQDQSDHESFPDDWKTIPIDKDFLVSLRSAYVIKDCATYNSISCSILNDIYNHEGMDSIPGIRQLEQYISAPYNATFDYDLAAFYGSMDVLPNFASISTIRRALFPHIRWIREPVPGMSRGNQNMTLLDTYEVLIQIANFICFERDQAGNIQNGPLINSLVESQEVALGIHNGSSNLIPIDGNKDPIGLNYWGKKMILYSTHDYILESLLTHLQMRKALKSGENFRDNYLNLDPKATQVDIMLGGVKRPEMGASTVFELWKTKPLIARQNITTENSLSHRTFPFIRVVVYNNQDATDEKITFERVKMGIICKQAFKQNFGAANLDRFYSDAPEIIDDDYDCPFELWNNITNHKRITNNRFQQLCDG